MTALWKRRFILFFGLFENLIFTGTLLGWSALNYMLKHEGVYSHLCHVEHSSVIYDDEALQETAIKLANLSASGLDVGHERHRRSADAIPMHESLPPPIDSSMARKGETMGSPDSPSSASYLMRIASEMLQTQPSPSSSDRVTTVGGHLLSSMPSSTALMYRNFLASAPPPQPSGFPQYERVKDLSGANLTLYDEAKAMGAPAIFDQLNPRASSSKEKQSLIDGCVAQDKILNLAYTIGSFCMGFSAFIWGFLLDRWGLRRVRLIINILLTAGTVLLCLTSRERSYMIFPAVILMSFGGIPLRIANMQLANYYPKQRSTIITLYSGAFSASSIIFVLIKFMYDGGLSLFWSNFVLVLCSVAMFPFTYFVLPVHRVEEEREDELDDSQLVANGPHMSQRHRNLFKGHIQKPIEPGLPSVTLKNFTKFEPTFISFVKPEPRPSMTPSTGSDVSSISDVLKSNRSIPLSKSLLSIPYLLHQWWYSWLITYMVMYVGSMNLWLQRTTDDLQVASQAVKIYGFAQVLGLILAPTAGFMLDRRVAAANKEQDSFKRRLKLAESGFWPLLYTTLSLVALIICRFFDTTTAIYTSIIFITLLRSFLIAVASAFIRIRFPADHFNRLLGIMSTVGATVTLLQFPLFVWEAQSPANALYVNLFNSLCTAIALLNPLHLKVGPLQKYLIAREQKQEIKYLGSEAGSRGTSPSPTPSTSNVSNGSASNGSGDPVIGQGKSSKISLARASHLGRNLVSYARHFGKKSGKEVAQPAVPLPPTPISLAQENQAFDFINEYESIDHSNRRSLTIDRPGFNPNESHI